MSNIKNLQGQCQQCGGVIEFSAESAGLTADCPLCGQPTELLLVVPPEEGSPLRTKAIIFTVIAAIILIGGLGGAVFALNRAKRIKTGQQTSVAKADAQTPPKPVNPFAAQNFRVSAVAIDKSTNNTLIYAVGSIVNITNRQRFGVKVELDLLDTDEQKIGMAKDYQSVIEPNAEWRFRALVTDRKTVSAKVAAIKEEK